MTLMFGLIALMPYSSHRWSYMLPSIGRIRNNTAALEEQHWILILLGHYNFLNFWNKSRKVPEPFIDIEQKNQGVKNQMWIYFLYFRSGVLPLCGGHVALIINTSKGKYLREENAMFHWQCSTCLMLQKGKCLYIMVYLVLTTLQFIPHS